MALDVCSCTISSLLTFWPISPASQTHTVFAFPKTLQSVRALAPRCSQAGSSSSRQPQGPLLSLHPRLCPRGLLRDLPLITAWSLAYLHLTTSCYFIPLDFLLSPLYLLLTFFYICIFMYLYEHMYVWFPIFSCLPDQNLVSSIKRGT